MLFDHPILKHFNYSYKIKKCRCFYKNSIRRNCCYRSTIIKSCNFEIPIEFLNPVINLIYVMCSRGYYFL